MEYPSWAPPDLVKHHKAIADIEAFAKSKSKDWRHQHLPPKLPDPNDPFYCFSIMTIASLLDRFVFCEDAKTLWESLNKTDAFRTGVCTCYRYWRLCEENFLRWTCDPKHTVSEKEQELEHIAKKALELDVLISKSSYMSRLRMKDIRPNVDGMYGCPDITENEERSTLLHGLRGANSTTQSLPDKNLVRLLSYYHHMSLGDILHQIASIADDEKQYGPIVSRPNSAHAKRQFVARCLKEAHMSIFGTPMWDALALACTLIVNPDRPLTADDVRPYCR